jgi:hypothetical protein
MRCLSRIALLLGLGLVAGCGSTELVSASDGKIVIAADGMAALPEATEEAGEMCPSGRAELLRTETVEDGIVAYYECR